MTSDVASQDLAAAMALLDEQMQRLRQTLRVIDYFSQPRADRRVRDWRVGERRSEERRGSERRGSGPGGRERRSEENPARSHEQSHTERHARSRLQRRTGERRTQERRTGERRQMERRSASNRRLPVIRRRVGVQAELITTMERYDSRAVRRRVVAANRF